MLWRILCAVTTTFDVSYVERLQLQCFSLSTIMKHTHHKNVKLSFKHRLWILYGMTTSIYASLLLSYPPWSLTLRWAGLHKLKRTMSLTGCLLQIHVHSIPLHNWAFNFKSLNFWLCLQCFNGAFMDPIWNSYNKLSIKLLGYLHKVGLGLGVFYELKLTFLLSSILWRVVIAHLFSILPPW